MRGSFAGKAGRDTRGEGGPFWKKVPLPPGPPNPSKNFYSGRSGRSPSGGHRAWHRALPSGEALGTRWHLSRRPARTQWSVRGRRGMEGGWGLRFFLPGNQVRHGAMFHPSCKLGERGKTSVWGFFPEFSPKKKKACVPAGTQAVKARFGERWGRGGGGPLFSR